MEYEFSWYLEVLVSVGMLRVSMVSEFNLRFGSLGFALNWLGILSACLVPSKYQTLLENQFFCRGVACMNVGNLEGKSNPTR